VFNGNALKWRKFGNTLYLRYCLSVSGKADVSADVIAKIKQIVDTNPMLTRSWRAMMIRLFCAGLVSGALTSPFIGGVREQDWRQPSVGEFFINNLNRWADPRLTANRWSICYLPGWLCRRPKRLCAGRRGGP
jgi:hypothetical protein